MKPGLRLQILLLLGALLTLALVPLFFAVATYTSVALTELRTVGARSLGRAVASHISDARGVRSPAALVELLESQVGIDGQRTGEEATHLTGLSRPCRGHNHEEE